MKSEKIKIGRDDLLSSLAKEEIDVLENAIILYREVCVTRITELMREEVYFKNVKYVKVDEEEIRKQLKNWDTAMTLLEIITNKKYEI